MHASTASAPDRDTVRAVSLADGTLGHFVPVLPAQLPPVSTRDLDRAWDRARGAALAAAGRPFAAPARLFRFHGSGAAHVDLVLSDRDARCWAAALAATTGLDTLTGISLCLRLLALVDLIARSPWAAAQVDLRRDGAVIDPVLLRLAASMKLDAHGRFDESALCAHVSPHVAAPGMGPASRPTGAPA